MGVLIPFPKTMHRYDQKGEIVFTKDRTLDVNVAKYVYGLEVVKEDVEVLDAATNIKTTVEQFWAHPASLPLNKDEHYLLNYSRNLELAFSSINLVLGKYMKWCAHKMTNTPNLASRYGKVGSVMHCLVSIMSNGEIIYTCELRAVNDNGLLISELCLSCRSRSPSAAICEMAVFISRSV